MIAFNYLQPLFILVSSTIFSFITILIFQKKQLVQEDRPEVAAIHNQKRVLISMGGIAILLSLNIFALYYSTIDLDILMLGNAFGLLGLVDDYIKLKHKKPSGLLIKARLFFEIVFASYFIYHIFQIDPSRSYIPIFNQFFNIHALNFIWGIWIILSSSNSYNLTDGVDSLAATTGIYTLLFAFITLGLSQTAFSLYLIAAILGFLIFNWPPARLIMGDVGALSIGAMIGGIYYKYHLEWFLPFVGIIFVIETLSVIIQMFGFKVLKRRVFLFAPFHHHLEKKGWSRRKILLVLNIIAIFALIVSLKVGL